MQWIKFGGALVAGASLLALDVIALSYALAETKQRLLWLRMSLVTLLGFLIGEGSLIALLYLLLPTPLASEVLWPSWMVQNYAAYGYKTVSFLHWFNMNYFFGIQLAPLAAALTGIAFVGHLLFGRRVSPAGERPSFPPGAGAPLFLVIFFVLALMVYLPHMWVAMFYVWMILLPAAFFLHKAPVPFFAFFWSLACRLFFCP